MKKSLNNLALLAVVGVAAFSSCSREVDYYNPNAAAEEYAKNWEETFGTIDSQQDWNAATQVTANVNLDGKYEVKVYTSNPINSDSRLMADYMVDGSKSFTFDAAKGLTDVFVTAENSNGNLAVNSYVSLSNGALNIDNTTKAATRAESCPVTMGDAIELSTSKRYNFVTLTNTLIEATFVPLVDNDPTTDSWWYVKDILPIVGTNGVFKEGAANKTTYIPSKLTKDVSFKAIGSGIKLSFVYGGTLRYNKIAYFYWTDEEAAADSDAPLKATKYVLIDDARPHKNVFEGTDKNEVNGGMQWPSNISGAEAEYPYYSKDNVMFHSTYRLVYFDEEGNASYEFPEGVNVAFMMIAGKSDNTPYNFDNTDFADAKYNLLSSISSQNEYYGQKEWSATSVSTTAIAAVSYRYGDNLFLGFEDQADQDLNDVLFTLDGVKKEDIPDIDPDQTPTQAQSWIIACEDLGDTDDYDFNDVVVEVAHASGQTTATITPLAAGGTLASNLYFTESGGNVKDLGEIHSLLGESGTDGSYPMINTTSITKTGTAQTVNVVENFSVAYDEAGQTNMGGFSIKVSGSEDAKTITAPSQGDTPMMILVPGTWKWPTERTRISSAYDQFTNWSKSANTSVNWYDTVTGSVVSR